jgi:hypothetical protein
VFKDQQTLDAPAVHLHLEHRFVQRLLGRFRSQGFVHTDLHRVCVVLTDDPVARVLLLGRLSLYGDRAARLHDQVMAVAAPWVDATARKSPLAMDEESTAEALQLLEKALSTQAAPASPQVRSRLTASAARDLEELRKSLEQRQARLAREAIATLKKRGDKEATEMRAILESQRKRILDTEKKKEKEAEQLALFAADELKQLEADKRYWHRRLQSLEQELTTEPERIRKGYEVRATRFEPVGLVYLWPVTG